MNPQFLRERIGALVGDGVWLIDTGAAVARELRRRLGATSLLDPAGGPADCQF